VFEHSNIPMTLVDRDLRYVAVNDAALSLFEKRRQDVVGQPAGTHFVGGRSSTRSSSWQELLRNNELYGESVIPRAGRPSLRVSFAAHTTRVDGRWLVLFVTLSAKPEPDGSDLIGTPTSTGGSSAPSALASLHGAGAALTPREREVIRRVALGRSTPQIARDLNLSPATVRSHVRNAMVKVGAHTRAQLVALVLGDGLADR
jgi:DNA-binding CsgD family transcriptional regulator